MSNSRTQLRSLGYSADADGNIVCHREGPRGLWNRYLHECTAVIRIDLVDGGSKPVRELVERLVSATDEPRSLVARSRNGSAVLLFKVNEFSDLPVSVGEGVYELVTSDGELLNITCASLGQTLDVGAWSWAKNRSPYEVSRDSLAVLFKDVAERVVNAAYAERCSQAPTAADRARAERIAKLNQGIADGTIKPRDFQAEDDERLVAAHRDVGPFDSMWTSIQNARQRIFERSAAG
jgi:hypothetical protein